MVIAGAPPTPAEQPSREADDARIDITLTNGRRMTISVSLAPSHPAALLAVLDPRSLPFRRGPACGSQAG